MINKRTINVYNLTNSWNVNLFTGLGTLAMGAVYNLTNSWNVNTGDSELGNKIVKSYII